MESGKLNRRIDIESKVETQDETGDPVATWLPWAQNVPAQIEPLSGSEFMGQNQILGRVVAKITIRWRTGLVETMRIKHGSDIYNIAAILPDKKTGRDFITIPVSKGTNVG